ncbi:hypothetical protein GQ55_1G043400 [Panicum hallii var. hallii]|uniref:CS domain-containing protein n=1 Tax=Panicum hallii var. hallii TaxID=1504633 RepID=A0A2T7F258_9POAL|nr:hypothetical protein GQ55_1G043400 [Panicum hallii var. hallii]
MSEKLAPEKRHAFLHSGQKVFEWDQTLEEVNMYIELPKGVPTKLFRCTIQAGHVEVGIRGNPPYLNDGEMHITLQKREKGKTWSSPIQGQGLLDPYAADQEQKRLMLQRFQEEPSLWSMNSSSSLLPAGLKQMSRTYLQDAIATVQRPNSALGL